MRRLWFARLGATFYAALLALGIIKFAENLQYLWLILSAGQILLVCLYVQQAESGSEVVDWELAELSEN
jgi:hypothetical protein